MNLLTEEYVRERYNKIKQMFDLKMPINFMIDNSIECPEAINTKEGSELRVPIQNRSDSDEDLLWLNNSIAHELSHIEFWGDCGREIMNKAIEDRYSLNYIGYHMMSEYHAYNKADELFHEEIKIFKSERDIQNMMCDGGRLLYNYNNLGSKQMYNLMLDYFDNIYKCYYSHDRTFIGCAEGFAIRLNEYIELLRSKNHKEMRWEDYETLYYSLIDILFADLPDRKIGFNEGIKKLIIACLE